MITKLVLRNFKGVEHQEYDFQAFDLLVGRNNSGKSTILQALAIWQFCVDEFHRAKRRGATGKQIVLPNFTALPLPEFNLLWRNRTDRQYPRTNGKKVQEYILIEIEIHWLTPQREAQEFKVSLRYASPQSVYAIPGERWEDFRELDKAGSLPRIAYVPPFSGLEPTEEWRDDGPIRKQIGKAQPGSVLRNLLLRVHSDDGTAWQELKSIVRRWFSVDLREPEYEKGIDTQIVCEYLEGKGQYDIIAGGSGFHQALTLLAFLYGYKPTTILFDEPDAHLHVNLQREILEYLLLHSGKQSVQCLIATHAEEFIKGVAPRQVISLLDRRPIRVDSSEAVLSAMAEVSNLEVARLRDSPVMLYVEGESDERILRALSQACDAGELFDKVCIHYMAGGAKTAMKEAADRHFDGVRQIVSASRRLLLFDFDDADAAFHPPADNLSLAEWKRRNIENYLLVPDAWRRAASAKMGGDLLAQVEFHIIQRFFEDQNLLLPPRQTWRTLRADAFSAVNGKRLLFEAEDSLFRRLQEVGLEMTPHAVATHMQQDEIHDDVHAFFQKLRRVIEG